MLEGPTRVVGVPTPLGRVGHPRGYLVRFLTSTPSLLYIPTYPQMIRYGEKNLIPPPQPSEPVRSHLGAFAGAPPEGESTTEGLYIISKVSPMSCE